MNPSLSIPHLSTNIPLKEAPFRFSQWISVDFLISFNEMKRLFDLISPSVLISPHNACPQTPFLINKETFFHHYQSYIYALSSSKEIDFDQYKKYFYLMLCKDLEGIFLRKIKEDKNLLIFRAPYIEIKPICLNFSTVDSSIHVSAPHDNGVFWGFKFSFPQIMQDPQTLESLKINFQEHLTAKLFKKIRVFLRQESKPTPFIIHEKKVHHTVRLGHECFKWINQHPQLQKYKLHVKL